MTTESIQESIAFQSLGNREVIARLDGGKITSEAEALLLRELERRNGILQRFAACFTDHRDPERIEHTVEELIAQRVLGLCLGYEDLNDHDQLRHDPLLAVMVGKVDLLGQDRLREEDQGKALADKSTLNRLELTPGTKDKSKRGTFCFIDFAIQRGEMGNLWFIEFASGPCDRGGRVARAGSLSSTKLPPRLVERVELQRVNHRESKRRLFF